MELTAALLAAKSVRMLTKEVDVQIDEIHLWTDSQVVLGYLNNKSRNFKVYVANRVQQIHEITKKDMWHYVASKDNPADHASRGISVKQVKKLKQWFHGPEFLWKEKIDVRQNEFTTSDDNEELKPTKVVNAIALHETLIDQLAERTHSWEKVIGIMTRVQMFINNLKLKVKRKREGEKSIPIVEVDVEMRNRAKDTVIKILQRQYFKAEVEQLSKCQTLTKSSKLKSLNPFMAESILRVGGRLSNSTLPYKQKHPVILPKDSKIREIIIRYYHQKCLHGGRNSTINLIRQSGYWIVNCVNQVKRVISTCITCKKLFQHCQQPTMGDLPKDRTDIAPPFTFVGVDAFGPLIIKERRSTLKRYGILFTCLALRCVHIEVVHSLSTDSFILALRRFISRRGNVQLIRSDNGGNFVGAAAEIENAFQEMDQEKIRQHLVKNNIEWKRNPPYASHMGGVWERQIRSVRRILSVMMTTHKEILNEESLHTFIVEVEAMINSRPLTIENINSPDELPLCQINILTLKYQTIQPLPGNFTTPDKYSKKQWRRVQYLLEQFWSRWRREYLTLLQERKKWQAKTENLEIGDIVLIKKESPRCNWPMGKVTKVDEDKEGTVRSVELKIHRRNDADVTTFIRRPVTKLVLLLKGQSESPPKEPINQNM